MVTSIKEQGIRDKLNRFKVPYKKVDVNFSQDTTPKEFEDKIVRALEMWFEQHPA